MKLLVSGSHGFIGTALTERMERDGHEVIRLVRAGSPTSGPRRESSVSEGEPPKESSAHPTGSVPWDPTAGWVDRASLGGHGPIDAVVNLAGVGIGDRRWSAARRRSIEASRRLSTRLLADTVASLDPAPQVMVSASAIGIYGNRGGEVLSEASRLGSGFLANVCRSWEAATSPASDAGVRVVHLRSGIVLAAGGGVMGRLVPIFRLGLGGRLGSGRQYVSWITLEDELGVVVRAIEDRRLVGPVNATVPNAVTNAQLTRALGRALRRPTLFAVPRPLLEGALGRLRADEMLLASQRVVPEKLQSIGHPFTTTDITDAIGSAVNASG